MQAGCNTLATGVCARPTAVVRVSYLGAAQLAIWSANCLFIFGKKVLSRLPPGNAAGEALEKSKKLIESWDS